MIQLLDPPKLNLPPTGGLRAACWLAFATAVSLLCSAAHAAAPQDLFATAAAGSPKTVDHAAWDRLLKTYVKPGADGVNRVDYARFKRDGHADLKAYIRALEAVDPATLPRREQFALLANLYNAKTVDIVLDHYPG